MLFVVPKVVAIPKFQPHAPILPSPSPPPPRIFSPPFLSTLTPSPSPTAHITQIQHGASSDCIDLPVSPHPCHRQTVIILCSALRGIQSHSQAVCVDASSAFLRRQSCRAARRRCPTPPAWFVRLFAPGTWPLAPRTSQEQHQPAPAAAAAEVSRRVSTRRCCCARRTRSLFFSATHDARLPALPPSQSAPAQSTSCEYKVLFRVSADRHTALRDNLHPSPSNQTLNSTLGLSTVQSFFFCLFVFPARVHGDFLLPWQSLGPFTSCLACFRHPAIPSFKSAEFDIIV
ncbi:hypothetical protein J3458_018750 [Metarhizium acridum]|uniref:uncharacterized protein n=1 Tax=Metarhizium acridum TaxID=92637 RepID=UPI001C6B6F42|nr:hypothetical protein J3458_018750 [Metarhizium acridum]